MVWLFPGKQSEESSTTEDLPFKLLFEELSLLFHDLIGGKKNNDASCDILPASFPFKQQSRSTIIKGYVSLWLWFVWESEYGLLTAYFVWWNICESTSVGEKRLIYQYQKFSVVT